ncbi:MAG: N-6 DNA methylase [Leptospiraceae bacterium]|nr:N-6 DNA methylase [Leptospiraceae bacterium]MCP5494546.1 N-6 DNA methylase [Leptospiraceae bacterium]
MLNKETKKRIDDARDILVGQLPLPSDQIELITITLIFKFMNDMDKQMEEFGKRSYFVGKLKPYSWDKLTSNTLDAGKRVELFSKAIEQIQKADHLPQLFREIFKNMFLKFKDGNTLQRFLTAISGFEYTHSEELGNAFEYLLMTMGAQGANGQFRTPRNIIDFIVEVVDPDVGDSILDPACGTAGFLVSAFRHILRKHTKGYENYRITLNNNEKEEDTAVRWGDKLSVKQKEILGKSIVGYDITPMMVRLAQVNLYLHDYKVPSIHDYDTISSKDRWHEKYDCILANPPFMTSKGGVETHKDFKLQESKRAEVLFSDYILEHLTPNGKAGFIVPEGIIFQTSTDYVDLRKWMIEQDGGLWAVVSLPANVFQPYSGVKTSILFIDREFARKTDKIVLVKVENDGFSLNTNRNATSANDLPTALDLLREFPSTTLRERNDTLGEQNNAIKYLILDKIEFKRLDSYRAVTTARDFCKKSYAKVVKAKEDLEAKKKELEEKQSKNKKKQPTLIKGNPSKEDWELNRLQEKYDKQVVEFCQITGYKNSSCLPQTEEELISWFDTNIKQHAITYGVELTDKEKLSPKLVEILDGEREYNLSIDRYGKPKSTLNEKYPMVKLGEVCSFEYGKSLKEENRIKGEYPVFGSNGIVGYHNEYLVEAPFLVIGRKGSAGEVHYSKLNGFPIDTTFFIKLQDENKVLIKFLYYLLMTDGRLKNLNTQAGVPGLNRNDAYNVKIPLPPLEVQKQLVAEIEQYQKVIDGCNLIIDNYKPNFKIDPSWERVKLGEVARILGGYAFKSQEFKKKGIQIIRIGNVGMGFIDITKQPSFIDETRLNEFNKYIIKDGDILITLTGTAEKRDYGRVCFIKNNNTFLLNQRVGKVEIFKQDVLIPMFLSLVMQSDLYQENIFKQAKGIRQANISNEELESIEIPLPPLDVQKKIVTEIDEDMQVLDGVKRLKSKMEGKIKAVIEGVW